VPHSPGGLGVYYWAPEGSRGNGLWNPDGTPAPAIFFADGSRIPGAVDQKTLEAKLANLKQ